MVSICSLSFSAFARSSFETDYNDPDCPRKNEKCKRFWSFVKSLKKDASGITSLSENGILLIRQTSAINNFSLHLRVRLTLKFLPFTPMGEITVDPKGVLKLLNGLKVHKAPGPDGLSARVLKECSSEIVPISWPLSTMSGLLRELYQMTGDRQA